MQAVDDMLKFWVPSAFCIATSLTSHSQRGLSGRAVRDPHIPRHVDAISCGDNVVETSDSGC